MLIVAAVFIHNPIRKVVDGKKENSTNEHRKIVIRSKLNQLFVMFISIHPLIKTEIECYLFALLSRTLTLQVVYCSIKYTGAV